MHRRALLMFLCVLGCTGLAAQARAYTYTEILVPGLTGAVATAINDRGDIVGYGNGSTGIVGFLSSGGNFTVLSFPGSITTRANGINNARAIVGTYTDSAGSHGFEYSGGTWTAIDAPAPAAPNSTSLVAINNQGQIAGNAKVTSPPTGAFVDNGGTFTFVSANASVFNLYGINDSGELVGQAGSPSPRDPTLNAAYGTVNGITQNFAFNLRIFTAINNNGQVLMDGGFYQGGDVSYFQSSVTQTTTGPMILFPGANATHASGINNNGTIVGSWVDSLGLSHAFLAAPGAEPSCTATVNSGPPPQITFTVQNNAGITQIVVTGDINATTNIPPFQSGTMSAIVVTSQATNPAQTASVIVTATNGSGFSSSCGATISGTAAPWSTLGGVLSSNISTSLNPDGSLTAYALGSDSSLWGISQFGPGGPWGSWSNIGGVNLVSEPAAITDSAGHVELLVVSADGGLWNATQSNPGSWSGAIWNNIATGVKGRPAVVRNNSTGQLQAFVRAADDSLLYLAQSSPGSSDWTALSLGGVITSDPASPMFSSGDTFVAAIGTDQALWLIGVSHDGSTSTWFSFGGSIKGNPTATAESLSPGGRIFARGTDDAVWTIPMQGAMPQWQSLGGVIVNNPRGVVNVNGQIEVFVAGTDNAVWHNTEILTPGSPPQWTGWSSLGGVIIGDVSPALDASAAVNLFVRATDSGLWYLTQPSPDSWQ